MIFLENLVLLLEGRKNWFAWLVVACGLVFGFLSQRVGIKIFEVASLPNYVKKAVFTGSGTLSCRNGRINRVSVRALRSVVNISLCIVDALRRIKNVMRLIARALLSMVNALHFIMRAMRFASRIFIFRWVSIIVSLSRGCSNHFIRFLKSFCFRWRSFLRPNLNAMSIVVIITPRHFWGIVGRKKNDFKLKNKFSPDLYLIIWI